MPRIQEGEPARHQGRHEAKALQLLPQPLHWKHRKLWGFFTAVALWSLLHRDIFPSSPSGSGRSLVGNSDEGITMRKLLEDVARRRSGINLIKCIWSHRWPGVTSRGLWLVTSLTQHCHSWGWAREDINRDEFYHIKLLVSFNTLLFPKLRVTHRNWLR